MPLLVIPIITIYREKNFNTGTRLRMHRGMEFHCLMNRKRRVYDDVLISRKGVMSGFESKKPISLKG